MDQIALMRADLELLVGQKLDKPKGTLAGHAAALPVEDLVHARLEKLFPKLAFRQYEFLNEVLSKVVGEKLPDKLAAFGPPSIQGLLCRSNAQMKKWSPSSMFDVKQNDTAETVICQKIPFNPQKDHLILADVKSHNAGKNGQPPNIMSAGKLASALAMALEEGEIRFDFVYLGLSWEAFGDHLIVTSANVVSLFKMPPNPYINWAAAEQLQFQVQDAEQSYQGSREDWARAFLAHFSDSLEKRIAKQVVRLEGFKKFVH